MPNNYTNSLENNNIKIVSNTKQDIHKENKLELFKKARQEQLEQDSLIRKMNIENILEQTNIRGLK